MESPMSSIRIQWRNLSEMAVTLFLWGKRTALMYRCLSVRGFGNDYIIAESIQRQLSH